MKKTYLQELKSKFKQTPEYKMWRKNYRQTPEYKAWQNSKELDRKMLRKAYRQTEAFKTGRHLYRQTKEYKLYEDEWRKLYRKTSKFKQWRKSHREKKTKTNVIWCLRGRLKRQLYSKLKEHSISGKLLSSSEYGIDYIGIINYLKPTNEIMKTRHVDHIIPVSYFNLNNCDDIKLCFSKENLQWLIGSKNISKNNRIMYDDVLELKKRLVDNTLDPVVINKLLNYTVEAKK